MEVTASALDGQRFLHGLRADQLDALAATASEVMFPAGHRIFAEGGHVGSFWLIESGCFPRTSGRSARCASPRSRRSSAEPRPSGTAAPPTRTSGTSSPGGCSRYSRSGCRAPGAG